MRSKAVGFLSAVCAVAAILSANPVTVSAAEDLESHLENVIEETAGEPEIGIAQPSTEDPQEQVTEATPEIKVNYIDEKLTNFLPNAEYVIRTKTQKFHFRTAEVGKADLSPYYGQTIRITKKGDGITTADSKEQRLEVAAKQAAPVRSQFAAEISKNGKRVTLKNISAEYEYRKNRKLKWISGNGSDLNVRVGTIITIRKKVSGTQPASEILKFIAGYDDAEDVERQIAGANTDKGDVTGSVFASLCPKAKGKSSSVKLSWKKTKKASGYFVYGSLCGSNNRMEKIADVPATKKTYTARRLRSNKYYKFMIVAYQTIDGEDYVMAKSKVVRVSTTKKSGYGNPKKINVNKSNLSIKKGKKGIVKASGKNTKRKIRKGATKCRFESGNKNVAVVTKKGVVKGIKKGKTYVYAYTQNGIYKKIRVAVR